MSVSSFPAAEWGDVTARFCLPHFRPRSKQRAYAALVFAFEENQLVLCNIQGRGWSIPGGRLEQGETPLQAVRREAYEEAGLRLGQLRLLGDYLLTSPNGQMRVPVYLARVKQRSAPPPGFEGLETSLCPCEEIAHRYYRWDSLLENVCGLACERAAELTAGASPCAAAE